MSPSRPPPLVLCLRITAMTFFAWALVTPLGLVPDEPAHVAYANAVVRGQLGRQGPGDIRVPRAAADITYTKTCPAFRPSVTADCAMRLSRGGDVATTTSARTYPPLYYALVGWPSWFGFTDLIWYVMRFLSCGLSLLLIGTGVRAWRGASPWLAVGLTVAATPMVGFLAGSVNPNGAEICAAMGLCLGWLALSRRPQAPTRDWTAIGVPGGYLALARPGSWFLLAGLVECLVVLAPLKSRERRSVPRAQRKGLTVIAGCYLVGVAYQVTVARNDAASGGQPALSLHDAGALVIRGAGSWWNNSIGLFGWIDHQPPAGIRDAWLALLVAAATAAVLTAPWSQRLGFLGLAFGASYAAPLAAILTAFPAGEGYQARYAMALMQCVPLAAFAMLERQISPAPRLRSALALAVPALWVLGTLSLLGSAARYGVGRPLGIDIGPWLASWAWLPPAWPAVILLIGLGARSSLRVRRTILDGARPPVSPPVPLLPPGLVP